MAKPKKEEKWYKIQKTKKKGKIGIKTTVWAKGKTGLKFYKERNRNIKNMTKLLRPRICYSSEYDIFNINWGNKPIHSTIEANFLGEADMRFDITKNGTIVGIEIDNFSKSLKRFDCDKNKQFQKELKKQTFK